MTSIEKEYKSSDDENSDSFHEDDYTESESEDEIDQLSREKALACKFAIEQFYDNYFKSLKQRQTRYDYSFVYLIF